MKTSENIKAISKALFDFQGKVNKVIKGSTNPHFKSKYADLSNILDTIYPTLQQCGLLITQHPNEKQLITRLIHAESGEWFESACEIVAKDFSNAQAYGSGITYARRYALQSICGLNFETDDDGNAAVGKPTKEELTPKHPMWAKAVKFLQEGGILADITNKYDVSEANRKLLIAGK